MMSSRQWVLGVASISFVILLLMGYIVYAYDPYCYYRIPVDRLIVNNYRFLNAGLIRNANYDTVLIGSSMVQNFDMQLFREKLHINPVKLTVGALSPEGVNVIYSAVRKQNRAENVIFCVDIPSLNKEVDELKVYPLYLYDTNPYNDFKYLLGYETWMRLLPLNVLLNTMEKMGRILPQFYGTHDIDDIGAWDKDAVYGEEIVLRDYRNRVNQISAQNLCGIEQRMRHNADKLISTLLGSDDSEGDVHYIFFFPPYSALFWSQAVKGGYFMHYQSAKRYIVDLLGCYENVTVYDFQVLPEIMDLNNYKDTTHYSAKINDLMVEHFSRGTMTVNMSTVVDNDERLLSMVKSFDIVLRSKLTIQ